MSDTPRTDEILQRYGPGSVEGEVFMRKLERELAEERRAYLGASNHRDRLLEGVEYAERMQRVLANARALLWGDGRYRQITAAIDAVLASNPEAGAVASCARGNAKDGGSVTRQPDSGPAEQLTGLHPIEYRFDRYRDGQLMAEGVRISNAADSAEALRSARAMYPHGDIFVLRIDEELTVGHKQGCPALGGYGTSDRECICGAKNSSCVVTNPGRQEL